MNRKVPKSVTIGGQKFAIVIDPADNENFGEMHFDTRKIVLGSKCLAKASILRETLRHELLHAALHVSGIAFSEAYDEESIVRCIENIFFPAWDAIHKKLTTYENAV
jgi:hypothetical protein